MRRRNAKEKAKVGSKEPEEHSLVKSKHRTPNGDQQKIVLGGPKENDARRAFRKAMRVFGRVFFSCLPTREGFKQ